MQSYQHNTLNFLIGKYVHLGLMPWLLPISHTGSFRGKPLILGITEDKSKKPFDFTWLEMTVKDYDGQLDNVSLIIKKSDNPILATFKFDQAYSSNLIITESLVKAPTTLALFPNTPIKKIVSYREDDLGLYIVIEHFDDLKWLIHCFDWGMEINFNTSYIAEIESANDYMQTFIYN